MTLAKTLQAAGLAAALGLATSAAAWAHGPGAACPAQPCGWHQGWHWGPMMGQGQMPMMGPGMMGPGMMGPGMMGQGQGMGPGMMGQGQGMGPGMMGQGQGMGPGMMGQGQGQGMGPGMMGPGMGQGMMGPGMGQGMMGPGMGQGMGPGMMQPLRQDLSAADVTHMMEHRLAWHGNPNLKLGKVEEKDADTIVAEIVTQDGSLVQRLEVDRHTGWTRPAQ